jgi:hypothetical protein
MTQKPDPDFITEATFKTPSELGAPWHLFLRICLQIISEFMVDTVEGKDWQTITSHERENATIATLHVVSKTVVQVYNARSLDPNVPFSEIFGQKEGVN